MTLGTIPLWWLRGLAIVSLASAAPLWLWAGRAALAHRVAAIRARMAYAPVGARARRRELLARALVVVVVMLGSAMLALQAARPQAVAADEPDISPLPAASPVCRVQGEQARAEARAREQVAHARWERVPFAQREAPHAIAMIAEAESCYAAGGDRAARMRVAAVRRSFERELERRFTRARLALRNTLRERPHERARSDAQSRERAASAARMYRALRDLLDRAQPSAFAYRDELERLARVYAADAQARADRREQSP